MFPINFRTALFYLDQFPDSKNLRDYVPFCLVACGDSGSASVMAFDYPKENNELFWTQPTVE